MERGLSGGRELSRPAYGELSLCGAQREGRLNRNSFVKSLEGQAKSLGLTHA